MTDTTFARKLATFTFSLLLSACGGQDSALQSSTEKCTITVKDQKLVLGQPLVYTVTASGATQQIRVTGEKSHWINDNRPGELQFASDTQPVRGKFFKASAKGQEAQITMQFDLLIKESANQELRAFFVRPGTMKQTFQLSGQPGCSAELTVPVTFTEAYKQKALEGMDP